MSLVLVLGAPVLSCSLLLRRGRIGVGMSWDGVAGGLAEYRFGARTTQQPICDPRGGQATRSAGSKLPSGFSLNNNMFRIDLVGQIV